MDKKITEKIDLQLANIKKHLAGKEFDNVYFVGCGGGLAYMEPSKYVMDTEAKKIQAYSRNAAELMAMNPGNLGKRSIVIVSSYNGVMLEAVQALRWAKEKGAFVIGTTYTPDTAVANEADAAMIFNPNEGNHAYTCQYSAMLLITYTILEVLEGNKKIERLPQNLYQMENIINKARELYAKKTDEFVSRFKDAPIIYAMASGVNYVNAYVAATCWLLEMQWVNASPLNSSEFFHGAIEIVDKDSSFIMMMGLGETRAIDERALAFLNRFTTGTFVIDAKDFDMSGVDEDFQKYLAQIATNQVMRMLVECLADARYHSLKVRRYYGCLSY